MSDTEAAPAPANTTRNTPTMTPDFDKLAVTAKELRRDVLTMLHASASGHPGGSLGMTDVFTTLYFGGHMNVDPKNPAWEDRDRFVLSNGHICPILYAILAKLEFFPHSELITLRKLGSNLQGHPDTHFTKGVDACTGSLGNGVSVGLGMALGARIAKKDYRVYVGSSDGESQEGQVWEMASAAAHYKVDNLTVLIDRNGIQIDGFTKDVMDQGDLAAKYAAFGWHVQEVDGHDMKAVHAALEKAKTVRGQPQMICCHTLLGKGVSYMENVPKWHGVAPSDDELKQALSELAD
ncbi:MAG: transketolase [Planctomycetota bacterium]|nr:MAG: transketolase [Planctomycetota bacterium]